MSTEARRQNAGGLWDRHDELSREADVARTALQTSHALSTRRYGGPVATSYQLEDQIDVARSTTMPGSVLVMSLLVFFALLFPRGTPTAFGSAIAVNLVMGWFPTGDAAPRVTLLGLCTIAGGLFGPTFLMLRNVWSSFSVLPMLS